MTKLCFAVPAFLLFSLLTGSDLNAADGCGAGLYRDVHGRCHFYRAVETPRKSCAIGYIWRNGRCRQNVGNDPFVSTWPNAPSAFQER